MPWIFGYGSLMWDPFFPFIRKDQAVLPDYHRAFVMSFDRVWGRPESPCVVLGLEPGGSCEGIAYEVESEALPRIEEELAAFEGEAFRVARRTVQVAEVEVEAVVALNRPSHPAHLSHLSEAERIAMVLQARGPEESCLSYALKTAESLERLGIRDREVLHFVRQLKHAQG